MNTRIFGQQASLDPSLESLLTDGLGGFSLTSLAGVPTRCSSGLAASLTPPVQRWLMWVSPLEMLSVGDRRADLHAFGVAPGVYEGDGLRLTSQVNLRDLLPERVQVAHGARITRRTFMPRHGSALVYLYDLACPDECTLTLGGLFSDRDMHAVCQRAPDLEFEVEANRATVRGQQTLNARLWTSAGEVEALSPAPRPQRVYLPMERTRGGPEVDWTVRNDLWRLSLPPGGGRVALVVGMADLDFDPWEAREEEVSRRNHIIERAFQTCGVRDETVATLAVAADAFVVRRQSTDGVTVIAGYPWFADWGRDSMIALDGLLLQTGRFEEARSLLETFLRSLRHGLTPNNFAEDGSGAGYNTVDGALWLAVMCERYLRASGDLDFARRALPRLRESLKWHVDGSDFGIHLDHESGLLRAGEPGVQLTWMDVKIHDWVVTPRSGSPVEVQALWLAALGAESWLSGQVGEPGQFAGWIEPGQQTFEGFWNGENGYLFDTLGPIDASIRPNALIALALRGPSERLESALRVAGRELVTPQGTHTLAPADPRYLGDYGGPQLVRDAAYHQGTVWPWPLGAYTDLLLSQGRVDEADAALCGLRAHLWEVGLGSVSEVFSGDARTPGGCPFQAWSVAELLRAHVRVRRAQQG